MLLLLLEQRVLRLQRLTLFLLSFFGGIEGFKAEIILDNVLPKLKIFLYAHLPILIDGSRPAILDKLLIK